MKVSNGQCETRQDATDSKSLGMCSVFFIKQSSFFLQGEAITKQQLT